MRRSTERILTTHTGSLPRPPDLAVTLEALDAGTTPDPAVFDARVQRWTLIMPSSGRRARRRT